MLQCIVDQATTFVFATTFLVALPVYRHRCSGDWKYPPSLSWLPVVGSLPIMGKAVDWQKNLMEKTTTLRNIFSFHAGPE